MNRISYGENVQHTHKRLIRTCVNCQLLFVLKPNRTLIYEFCVLNPFVFDERNVNLVSIKIDFGQIGGD